MVAKGLAFAIGTYLLRKGTRGLASSIVSVSIGGSKAQQWLWFVGALAGCLAVSATREKAILTGVGSRREAEIGLGAPVSFVHTFRGWFGSNNFLGCRKALFRFSFSFAFFVFMGFFPLLHWSQSPCAI